MFRRVCRESVIDSLCLWYKLIPGGIFMDYIKLLVEDIHSVTMATINSEGKPITRIIDLMLYDEEGIYFLTARGKSFYQNSWTRSIFP